MSLSRPGPAPRKLGPPAQAEKGGLVGPNSGTSWGPSLVKGAEAYDLGPLDSAPHCDRWLTRLIDYTPWQQGWIKMFGRTVPQPRLISYQGDLGTDYRYSGHTWAPQPWNGPVGELRNIVQALTGLSFNSCLVNYYRDGQDSMGWHQDNEPGVGPWIASLSLGHQRIFNIQSVQGGPILKIRLGAGALLIMGPGFQDKYRHSLPKTKLTVGPRINLTFRMMAKPNQ